MAQGGRLSSPALKALLASTVVYVVPVNYADFGARFWFSVLASPRLNDTFETIVWISYVALTVFVQTLLAAALYLLFRRVNRFVLVPIIAVFLIIVAAFPLTVGAIWLDARAIPAIYRGREGASVEWQEACRVETSHLLAPTYPRYEFLERSARAWFVSHATGDVMLLGPACQRIGYTATEAGQAELRDAFKPEPGFDISHDAGLRSTLFDRTVVSQRNRTWGSEHGYQFTPTTLMFQRQYFPGGCVAFGFDPPGYREVAAESAAGCAALSGDSNALGSLERATYSVSERRVEITSAHEPGPAVAVVDISKVGSGFVSLEGVAVNRRSVLIRRQSSSLLHANAPDLEARGFSYEYSEVGFDGNVAWKLPRLGGADDARLVFDGPNWVWWQSESRRPVGCCRLEWNVGGVSGSHPVARGRSIISVSLCPTGKLIAVSVSDRHWTGKVSDSVYIIRTSDGREMFRRYLPPLAQSRVQFLGPEFLAYTDFDGSDGFVRVVKVPTNSGSSSECSVSSNERAGCDRHGGVTDFVEVSAGEGTEVSPTGARGLHNLGPLHSVGAVCPDV